MPSTVGCCSKVGPECSASGVILAARKKICAEHHADRAGAAMLKSARSNSGRRFAIQNEITNASSATVNVPAAGPYKRTAVKTNASEMEMETFAQASLTEAEPL